MNVKHLRPLIQFITAIIMIIIASQRPGEQLDRLPDSLICYSHTETKTEIWSWKRWLLMPFCFLKHWEKMVTITDPWFYWCFQHTKCLKATWAKVESWRYLNLKGENKVNPEADGFSQKQWKKLKDWSLKIKSSRDIAPSQNVDWKFKIWRKIWLPLIWWIGKVTLKNE